MKIIAHRLSEVFCYRLTISLGSMNHGQLSNESGDSDVSSVHNMIPTLSQVGYLSHHLNFGERTLN